MKHNWTYKKLGEVCTINYGTRVVQEKDKGSTYYVYGGGGATFMVDSYNREDCFIVSRFAMSPKCTRFVKGKFFLNDSGLSVSTKIKELSQPFLDKVILANNDTIYSMGKGMAQRNLDIPSFRNLSIPVPPLSIQSRIVSELDLLQSIIDKQKAQLKELDTLAQSIFYDMFGDPVENEMGWEVKKLEEICLNIVDCPHSTPKKSDRATSYPCIRTSELRNGTIYWDSMQYLDEENYKIRIARLKPIAGDIVFGREGVIGDAVVLPKGYFFSLGQRTMLLRANPKIVSNVFLHRVILSEWVKSQIRIANVSSTVAHLNIKDFKKFNIPVPPLSLQQSFANKIEAIEKQKELINNNIRETQMLFNAKINHWFN
ncbi:MAG: restriction endonuclease subunit S [Bacteroidales bacterium]|nr:restriction endonuclease subunit S [Bacteroidales bacterium]